MKSAKFNAVVSRIFIHETIPFGTIAYGTIAYGTTTYRPIALRAVLILLACLLMPVTMVVNSHADTFSIPNPSNSPEGVERPRRGMSMNEVLAEFGAPFEKKNPVGKPPITKWIYEKFTVSFEHEWVIHSSIKRKK